MHSTTPPLLVAATLALAACHPTSTPTTEGTLNGAATAIDAGSAPAASTHLPGTATTRTPTAAEAATQANTASAAIAAQATSEPASSAR